MAERPSKDDLDGIEGLALLIEAGLIRDIKVQSQQQLPGMLRRVLVYARDYDKLRSVAAWAMFWFNRDGSPCDGFKAREHWADACCKSKRC